MASEPNTNIGSTSTKQSTYTLPKEQEEIKKKETPKGNLFAFITDGQAKNAGLEDLFQKFDVNKNGKLDVQEYINYKKGYDPNTKQVFERKNINDYSNEEYSAHALKLCKNLKIDKSTLASIIKLKENGHVDTNKLAKEYFNVDLTKYSTKEEKTKAIEDAIKTKYAIPKNNESIKEIQALIDNGEINSENKDDSLFMEEVKRLRAGNYNDIEKERFGWVDGKDLTAEQLNKFAKGAVVRRQIVELTKYFAQADDNAQEIVIKNFENLNGKVQTGLIGVAVLSGRNLEERKNNAKLIKEQDLKLTTEIGEETFDMGVQTVQLHLSSKDAIEMASDKTKYASKEDNLRAFKLADATENYKVQRGDITQEEKDKNYVELYAASAHKLELASEAYKYVIDNTNDTNRYDTMNMLASTAYQIEDEAQRNGAINNIKNSGYYNDSVQENLDKSYAQKIQEQYSTNNNVTTNKPVQPSLYATNTNPIKNTNDEYYNQIIDSTINSGDDEAIKELTEKTFKEINQQGQTNKHKKLGIQRGMAILTKLISNNQIQNSSYEGIVLNKLSALPAPTLLNMFLGSNEKVQGYFYKNNLISPLTIAMNAGYSEIEQLPENIKEKVMIIKDENYLNKQEIV